MKPSQILAKINSVSSRIADVQAAGKDLGLISGRDVISLASSLKELSGDFEFSETVQMAPAGNSESLHAPWVAPMDLTITALGVAASGALPTGDPQLTIGNRDAEASTVKDPLAASFDTGTLADLELANLTLSATTANLEMNRGDVLSFSVTNDADDSHVGFAFNVRYKPRNGS